MKGKPLFLFIFLLLSALLSSHLLLVFQVPGFRISHQSFEPSPVSLVLLSALIFIILLALWALYARVVSRRFDRKEPEVLGQDFLSYLPLLLLSLTPLTLRHYIGSADLETRLRLFLLAIAVAIVYLKTVQAKRWSEAKAPFWQAWSQKFTALSSQKKITLLFLARSWPLMPGRCSLCRRGLPSAEMSPITSSSATACSETEILTWPTTMNSGIMPVS